VYQSDGDEILSKKGLFMDYYILADIYVKSGVQSTAGKSLVPHFL
jgi:hypothetical protein